MARPRFVADEMLGALARDLRALGYDVRYTTGITDDDLLTTALAEDRYLVTRDKELAQRAGDPGILLNSRDPEEQLAAVLDRLALTPAAADFLSRCLDCNQPLVPGPGDRPAPEDVSPETITSCPACKRTYWWGSHADDMLDRLGGFLDEPDQAGPEGERNR